MRHPVEIEICGVCPPGSGTPYRWCTSWSTSINARPNAVVSLGAFQSSVEEGESIASSAVTTFSLVADDNVAIGQRPVDIFTRVGAENLSADQVWQTYGVTAQTPEWQVVGTSSAISAGTYLHIGVEMALATSAHAASSTDYFFVDRAQGGTIAQPHRANLSGYFLRTIPITLHPVTWVGRYVNVYVDGALWRTGVLIDNPQLVNNQIQFQWVGIENLLSTDRSGEYIPANGTTLAPTLTAGGPWNYWRPFYSFPALQVSIPSGVTGVLSITQILGADIDAPLQVDAGQFADQVARAWYHYDYDTLGISQYPRVYLTFSRQWRLANQNDTGAPEFTLETVQNDYYYYYQGDDLELAPHWDTGQTQYLAIDYSSYTSTACWYWTGVQTEAYSSAGLSLRAVAGNQTSYYGDQICYGSDYEGYALLDVLLQANQVCVQNNASVQAGYCVRYATLQAGICSRRNLRPGEIVNNAPNGNLFNGLPPLNVWGSLFPNRQRPCEPDRWSKSGDLYPVRPRVDGDVHNQYSANGCLLTYDSWAIDRQTNNAAIPADVATAYWEIGQQYILTVAFIWGVGDDYTDVSVAWTEPDGVELTATAEVARYTAGDRSPYYAYRIRNVRMADGSPCVGFGSWPGQPPVTITRPVKMAGKLGSICAHIIASGDGTTNRIYDFLGDGLNIPLTAGGALSLEVMDCSGIADNYWQFSPTQRSYGEFLRLAALLSGTMLVCKPTADGYGPWAVHAGRPDKYFSVASWMDADFVGLPSSGSDNGLVYTGYKFTTPNVGQNADPTTTTFPDWLAADLFGQGEELEVDFAGIYSRPRMLTTNALAGLVEELHDRFGTARRRWSVRIPIDLGLQRTVGDVVSITSTRLIAADGTVGVSNALARIMSISHDLVGGVCDVELLAYAYYGAGYSNSYDATITAISGTTYTLTFGQESGRRARALRQRYDRMNYPMPAITSGTNAYVWNVAGAGCCGYMYGRISAWAATDAGGTCTFERSNYTSPLPDVGTIVLLTHYSTPTGAFSVGTDRLL